VGSEMCIRDRGRPFQAFMEYQTKTLKGTFCCWGLK